MACADFGHGLLVGGTHGRRGQRRVAQGHLGGDVSEERHECLQAHAGVDEFGAVGVAQLVGRDAQRATAWAIKPGVGDGLLEPAAQPVGAQPAAAFHEQEVGGSLVTASSAAKRTKWASSSSHSVLPAHRHSSARPAEVTSRVQLRLQPNRCATSATAAHLVGMRCRPGGVKA